MVLGIVYHYSGLVLLDFVSFMVDTGLVSMAIGSALLFILRDKGLINILMAIVTAVSIKDISMEIDMVTCLLTIVYHSPRVPKLSIYLSMEVVFDVMVIVLVSVNDVVNSIVVYIDVIDIIIMAGSYCGDGGIDVSMHGFNMVKHA